MTADGAPSAGRGPQTCSSRRCIARSTRADRESTWSRSTPGAARAFFEALGAAGLQDPRELKPWYVMRRVGSGEVRSYHDIYPSIEAGALLTSSVNGSLGHAWRTARPDSF